jgi:hypothetical protein
VLEMTEIGDEQKPSEISKEDGKQNADEQKESSSIENNTIHTEAETAALNGSDELPDELQNEREKEESKIKDNEENPQELAPVENLGRIHRI